MGALDRAALIEIADRAAWRRWLEENHARSTGVWLVTGRSSSSLPRIDYEDSIIEALRFGWIDGQAGTVDAERGKLYFAPRRPGSPWARSNRERVERLIAAGRMTPAGMASVDRAKADGSWSALDSAERLELPPDLDAALAGDNIARANWDAYPDGVKRHYLASIALAKRPDTRTRRIRRAVDAARRNERPG